ncbi:hypothetical protein RE628_15230 [Paenibacillus sp. D2_2]|nr:hypothetical protein [Paenibacillus sp. D2_2]WMT38893.1 hypothetical protein RE628_15230 [Paenibacillus sp. D2_2]
MTKPDVFPPIPDRQVMAVSFSDSHDPTAQLLRYALIIRRK